MQNQIESGSVEYADSMVRIRVVLEGFKFSSVITLKKANQNGLCCFPGSRDSEGKN
jgi:hypothetical protein